MLNLVVVTTPTEEPITLAQAKEHLRVDGTDEDALIGTYISAARLKCEELSRRAFVTQTLALVLDCWPDESIVKLPRPPLISLTSVIYKDSTGTPTTWGSSNYVIDTFSTPGRLALASGMSWPGVTLYPIGGVKITYQAGYGAASAVPEIYKQAVKLLTAFYYENREQLDEIPKGIRDMLLSDRGWYFNG